jgi:hypothetical protein
MAFDLKAWRSDVRAWWAEHAPGLTESPAHPVHRIDCIMSRSVGPDGGTVFMVPVLTGSSPLPPACGRFTGPRSAASAGSSARSTPPYALYGDLCGPLAGLP